MKSLTRAVVAVACVLSVAAFAKETTTTMKVSGWMCAGCPAKTESALATSQGRPRQSGRLSR